MFNKTVSHGGWPDDPQIQRLLQVHKEDALKELKADVSVQAEMAATVAIKFYSVLKGEGDINLCHSDRVALTIAFIQRKGADACRTSL